MKRLALNLLILVTPFLCKAQEKTIITKNQNGIICSVEFSKNDKEFINPQSAAEFFKNWLNIGSDDEFVIVPHISKKPDYKHEHFDQYYKGIKVENAGYNFHYQNGEMYFAHGHYAHIINLNTTQKINAESAIEIFAIYKNIPKDTIMDYKSELIIKEMPVEKTNNITRFPKLVYKVSLHAFHHNNNEIGYIDALTGEILLTIPNRVGYGDTGTFYTRYNGTKYGNTQYFDDHGLGGEAFHLVDSSRGATINVSSMWGLSLDGENLNDNNI